MRIGFITQFKDSQNLDKTGVWGEEIVSNAYCKALNKKGHDSNIYSVFDFPEVDTLDVAIYMSAFIPPVKISIVARKNILWIQGFNYENESMNQKVLSLDIMYLSNKNHYDKVITASRVLADKYNLDFIIPPVDLEVYKDVEQDEDFKRDMSFIGNIIKKPHVNKRYLHPMGVFNYGLYGGDFKKVSHDDWLKIVCSSKINIHFGFEEGIEWDMVTGRPFFVSACKAFTLCDKVPFFLEHFKDCMGFTDGDEEERGQLSYYLQREEERKNMAEKAYNVVKNKFSNDVLVNELLSAIEQKEAVK